MKHYLLVADRLSSLPCNREAGGNARSLGAVSWYARWDGELGQCWEDRNLRGIFQVNLISWMKGAVQGGLQVSKFLRLGFMLV